MATLTVYSGVEDGMIASSNDSYSSARSGSNLSVNTSLVNGVYCGAYFDTFQNPDYWFYEGFMRFDTSSIPDGDTVSSASLGLSMQGGGSGGAAIAQARLYAWGPSLTTTDFIAGTSLASKTLLASKALASFPYNSISDLTSDSAFAANINKIGYTEVVLCTDEQVAGTVPNSSSPWLVFAAGDATGTTNDPRLTIIYAPPNTTPNIPTLDTPTSGSAIYANQSNLFQFDATDADSGDTMSAYALRITIDGVTRWWRGSDNTWQSTETYNGVSQAFPVSNYQVTIGANEFNDFDTSGTGTWSVAVKDLAGAASSYSTTNSFTIAASSNNAPNAPTMNAPGDNVQWPFGRPMNVTWVFSDPDVGDTQSAYAIKATKQDGTTRYWQALDSTWQVSETYNIGASGSATIELDKAFNAPPDYVDIQVAAKDAAGLVSPYSSSRRVWPGQDGFGVSI